MKSITQRVQRSGVVLWILITAMLVLIVVSAILRREEPDLEPPPEKANPVHVTTVETRAVTDLIRLPGRIEPDLRAQLAVDKGGRIVEIHADKGDRVSADQLLLRTDDRTWRAMLENAEIEMREAEKDYKRWNELARTGAVSTSEYDAVRTRLDRARVQRDEARVHVDQCEVRSPVDGIINERFVEVGEHAPEGAAVFELVVSNPAKLILNIPERDIGAVEPDADIAFTVTVLNNAAFTGTVTHIAEAAHPANNSYRVEVTVPNEDRKLRPGMIASAELLRARHDEAVVVPLSAVIPRQGEHFVFLAEADRAVRRLVKIDRILGADVILADGLQPGEELIVEGHRELIDGSLIERVPDEDRTTRRSSLQSFSSHNGGSGSVPTMTRSTAHTAPSPCEWQQRNVPHSTFDVRCSMFEVHPV